MNKIDLVTGIAFLSGILLLAVTAQIIFAPILVAVVIFSAYYTGRLTGKKEFLQMLHEVMDEEFEKLKKKREDNLPEEGCFETCTGCLDNFDIREIEEDSDSNYFCKRCYEELGPLMNAEYNELVRKGEIEKEER